ncbi:MAG: aspartate-semialdehyde dehydrogenase [Deltaproteobacteria bacterium]|nr:aspartate-semialdehyde dehydrogenase [Deltaproteobacteria bacterium]MBI3390212.1 aspartate-semialdehyde dehydrogenase [Deltaproteobacteria bacterium]
MKKKVAVVGATGIAGQQFLVALDRHPWFEVAALAASSRSAGKTYAQAIRDPATGARRWWCNEEPPDAMMQLSVQDAAELNLRGIDLVFSAVESDVARELEPKYAATTPVVSNASAFRYHDDVPILVPGVNLDHIGLLDLQRRHHGWKGFITPLPNCTTIGMVIAIKPLYDAFGITRCFMTSMQGLSGAGRSPGVIGLDIVDNIIPYVHGEEEKVSKETGKILGRLVEGGIVAAPFPVSATCTRAAVIEGHTESVVIATERPCSVDAAKQVMREFGGDFAKLALPSAPRNLIIVHDDPFRPQPRLDRDVDGGMATSVGRVRADHAIENGLKFVLVSHNTKMGAAKGSVLVAEHLASAGYV